MLALTKIDTSVNVNGMSSARIETRLVRNAVLPPAISSKAARYTLSQHSPAYVTYNGGRKAACHVWREARARHGIKMRHAVYSAAVVAKPRVVFHFC